MSAKDIEKQNGTIVPKEDEEVHLDYPLGNICSRVSEQTSGIIRKAINPAEVTCSTCRITKVFRAYLIGWNRAVSEMINIIEKQQQ